MAETTDELTADVAALAARVAMIEDHLGMVPPPSVSPPPPPPPPVVPPPPPMPDGECPECGYARDLLLSLPDTKVVAVGEVLEIAGTQTIPNLLVQGTLRHLDGSLLRTRTVLVDHGRWEAGTPDSPVSFGVEIIDAGPLDPVADPQAIGGGVIVHGSVRLYGTDKARVYSANPNRNDARGHVMLMSNDAVTRDVGFDDLGRTDKSKPVTDAPDLSNKRGRYPLHFHLAGTGQTPAAVQRCRVSRSPGWAFVNHNSSVNFRGNTDVDCFGAGVATETGGETGVIENHTSIGCRGIKDANVNDGTRGGLTTKDFGIGGHGVWIQGGGGPVSVNGTKVDGCDGIGMVHMNVDPQVPVPFTSLSDPFYAPFVNWLKNDAPKWLWPAYLGEAGTIPSDDIPAHVNGLEVSNCGQPQGLYMWDVMNPTQHQFRSLIENSTFNQCMVLSGYSNKTDHRNVRVLGWPDAPRGAAFGHTGVVADHGYYDCEAVGWGIGLQAPSRGENIIKGGKWGNVCDFLFLNQSNPESGRSITVDVDESNFVPLQVEPAAFPIDFNGRALPPGRWRYACVMWFVWIDIDKIKAGSASDPWAPGIFHWKGTLGHDSIRVPHTVTGAPVYIHPYEVCRDYPLDGLPIRDDIRQGCATSGELYDKTGYALWGTVPVAGQAMPGLYGQWSADPAQVIEAPKIPAA